MHSEKKDRLTTNEIKNSITKLNEQCIKLRQKLKRKNQVKNAKIKRIKKKTINMWVSMPKHDMLKASV